MRRKLGMIIALSVVGVLVITTIMLSVFSKNYKPEFDNAPYEVVISNKNDSGFYYGGTAYTGVQKENFDEFVKLFDSSFKQSVLASMLNGNLGQDVSIEYHGSSIAAESGYRVEFKYSSTLLKKDGVAFKQAASDPERNFTSIIFYVAEGSGYSEFNMFAKVNLTSTTTGYYEITTLANTAAMYEFLTELNYI